MIGNLSENEFAAILHRHLSPTSPIQSEERLFGRERQMQQIDQGLYAPGRSVFIYGDRGVGKTSLAQTVAYSHQSATHNPVLLACDPESTFSGILAQAVAQLKSSKHRGTITTMHNLKVGIKGFEIDTGRTRHQEPLSKLEASADLNEVMAALLEVASERRGERIVVVIDEFDRIQSEEERARFADFIKQIGDQGVGVRFVFCGVADSLQKLLGAHESCFRYLINVELKSLGYEGRFDIIKNAADALNVRVEERHKFRIAAISDGFPHYIHRICEELFWGMFRDPHSCDVSTADHYRAAVAQSVVSIEQHLKLTYDKATMKEAPGFEEVLWAVADHSDLIRSTESIFSSYTEIMRFLNEEDSMFDRPTVVGRLNLLKGAGCGKILAPHKKGWYQFREGIMRGYVRLRAEEQECELALDFSAPSKTRSGLGWKPKAARRSFGTSPRDRRKMEYPD